MRLYLRAGIASSLVRIKVGQAGVKREFPLAVGPQSTAVRMFHYLQEYIPYVTLVAWSWPFSAELICRAWYRGLLGHWGRRATVEEVISDTLSLYWTCNAYNFPAKACVGIDGQTHYDLDGGNAAKIFGVFPTETSQGRIAPPEAPG